MDKQTTKIGSFLLILCLFLMTTFFSASAAAANYPLEIINIKPAGTGNPAISPGNRIFRAYPGIEYNIRAAVIGGVYPYHYSLSKAPAGMTIDSFTGEIVWPNPQSNSGTITISVTDQENITVTTTWDITVSTNGFLFVDSSHTGIESGSIAEPYTSIENLHNATGSGNRNDIVYFRGGTYTFPDGSGTYLLNDAPHNWIGFPGDTVNIFGNGRIFRTYSGVSIYIDNLNWREFTDQVFVISGGTHYHTIRRCMFDTLTSSTATNNNQGFIYTTKGGSGYGLVIQDNSFTNFTGAQAIGSLYSGNKLLIENNHTYDGGYRGPHHFTSPIGVKSTHQRYTIRGNKIIIPSNASMEFELYNNTEQDDNAEICFNLFVRLSGGNDNVMKFFSRPNNIYMYRNTFVGNIAFHSDGGPYYVNNNVIIGGLTNIENVISNNNLIVASQNNVLDSNYNLTESYSEYIGTHGWQIASLPPLKNLIPPTNLSIAVKPNPF